MLNQLENNVVNTNELSGDWIQFERKLAAVLATLTEDQCLVIPIKSSNQFIQFAAQGKFGMRIETTSNNYLADGEKLTEQQIAALTQAGWIVPTASPQESTPEKDPTGSPNYFHEFDAPVSFDSPARLAVTTLAGVFHIPDTTHLEYFAFDKNSQVVLLPELGLPLENDPTHGTELKTLNQEVLVVLAEITGIPDLQFDADGDVGLSYKSRAIFVRLIDNGRVVRFYSPITGGITPDHELLSRLNELNSLADEKFVRYVYKNDAVFVVAEISGSPLDKISFIAIFDHFSKATDKVGNLLRNELACATDIKIAELSHTLH